jgi:hypothetical protein
MPNPTRADFLNRSPMRSLILYSGRPRPHRHFRKSPRSARRYQDDGVYLRLGYTHDPNPLAYGQPYEHEPTPSSCCSITGAGTWVFLNDINDKISVRLYAGRGPLIGGRRSVPRKSVRPCFFDCDRAGTTSEAARRFSAAGEAIVRRLPPAGSNRSCLRAQQLCRCVGSDTRDVATRHKRAARGILGAQAD